MGGSQKNRGLAGTWPLFDEGHAKPFPADPRGDLSSSSPGESELAALDEREQFQDAPDALAKNARRVPESLPPLAPAWMRAARTMADGLEERFRSGRGEPVEQACIARTWAVW